MQTTYPQKLEASPLHSLWMIITSVCLILGYVYFFLEHFWDTSGVSHLLLLLLIQITPFIYCTYKKKINFISIIMLQGGVSFTIAQFNEAYSINNQTSFSPIAIQAYSMTIQATVVILFCYYTLRFFLFSQLSNVERYRSIAITPKQTKYLTYFVVFSVFMRDFIPPQLFIIQYVSSVISYVLVFNSDSKEHPRYLTVCKWVGFLGCSSLYLTGGVLGNLYGYATIVFLAACLRLEKKNIVLFTLLFFLLCIVQTVKHDYRIFNRENPYLPVLDKISYMGYLLSEKISSGSGTKKDTMDDLEMEDEIENPDDVGLTIRKGFGRAGDNSLQIVLAKTPREIPFWGGETYMNLPYIFIPRFLWPDKPALKHWNKFGRVYGVLSSEDFETSVGVSFLAEGYMNFGYAGFFAVAIIYAFLVAMVERLSVIYLNGFFSFSFVAFLLPFTAQGDLGSIINSIVIVTGILFLFRIPLIKSTGRDDYSA